jgi:hypothetical protein
MMHQLRHSAATGRAALRPGVTTTIARRLPTRWRRRGYPACEDRGLGQAGFWPMVMPGAPSGVGTARTVVSLALRSRL